jgi:PAS domain S-box-containing protein
MDRPSSDKDIRDDKFLNALSGFELQEAILNSIEVAIFSFTPQGIITAFNKSSEDLFGYKRHELIGKASPLTLVDIDDAISKSQVIAEKMGITIEPMYDLFATYVANLPEHYRDQWELIRKDGVHFKGAISACALRDSHGTIKGYVATVTPTVPQAMTTGKDEVKKISDENSRIFNNAVTLNVVAGFDGYFKRVSESWLNLTGWTEPELKSRPFLSFVHPDDVISTEEAFKYIREGNHLFTFENRYLSKDGSYQWLLWSSAVDMKEQLIFASAINITHRKKSEEELLQSKQNIEAIAIKLQEQNRQLDEFAHIISHNLRSPVGNIKALINLLDENSGLQDYKLIFLKLKNVSQNLSDTMNDLMETLKVKTQSDLEKTENRFKDILDKVIQTLEGDLINAEASVTFDFNLAPVIYYPKAYLESIFQNLLTNSLKYRSLDRKAAIHFESRKVDDHMELRVTDNGQGIDLEKHGTQLFGLHRTFHTHDQARGVGLFLVKTQIESMGGSISADSVVGKGTTFTIKFF